MGHCVILTYHVIDAPRFTDESPYCCRPDDFRRQMDHIGELGYEVVPLSQVVQALGGGPELPRRSVAITFDDGTACTLETAAPILAERRFPATAFIVTHAIGGVAHWVQGGPGPRRMLTSDEVRALQGAGFTIGSHTASHAQLAGLPPPELRRELVDSKAGLEDLLGEAVPYFAFPYGSVDRAARDAAAAAGYQAACSRRSGRNGPRTDPFLLRRISMSGRESALAFAAKLRFGFEEATLPGLTRTAAKRALQFAHLRDPYR